MSMELSPRRSVLAPVGDYATQVWAVSAAEVTKSYFPSRAVSMWTGEVV